MLSIQQRIRSLKDRLRSGEKLYIRAFYGNQPSDDGKITDTCFSPWWMQPFTLKASSYCCLEQWIMSEKARMYRDGKALDVITKTDNPLIMKTWGDSIVKNNEEWEAALYDLLVQGNKAKFSSDSKLRDYLLSTGDDILVYASIDDDLKGVKLNSNDERIQNPSYWRGQNLLGFALMKVREDLSKEVKKS